MSRAGPILAIEGLSKSFPVGFWRRPVRVLTDLSCEVHENEIVGFLGPNGAGKTTVMRMLTAFLPPTSGRVVVAGVDLDQDPVGLRRNVGYLPENVPLYPELRVEEYLRFRADVEGVARSEVRSRTDEVIGRCLLGDVRRQVIGTLSKGYRQRVGLAGALIHQPPVLILDEPTVGLDPNQIIKVRELITELGRDHTVLLSTHILPEVEQVCERVFIIDRGRIVADGTPDALRAKLVGNPSLVVELKGADAAEGALKALSGVVGVESRGPGRFLLEHGPGSDPREAVFKLAVEKGWVLLALTQQQASLEDVFVRLTTREEPVLAAPVEEVSHA